MKLGLCWVFSVVIVLSSVAAQGQGVAWSQHVDSMEGAKIAVGDDGTTYVVTWRPYNYRQQVMTVIRYAPGGAFLGAKGHDVVPIRNSQVAGVHLAGGVLHVVGAGRDPDSETQSLVYYFQYSTATDQWNYAINALASDQLALESLAFGASTFCYVGESNGARYLRKHRYSDNAQTLSHLLPNAEHSNMQWKSGDVFVVSYGTPGGSLGSATTLIVSTNVSSHSTVIPANLEGLRLVVSRDGATAYLIVQYSGQVYVRPFDLVNLTYLAALTSALWINVTAHEALGTADAVVAGQSNGNVEAILRFSRTELNLVQLNELASNRSDLRRKIRRDSSGNAVYGFSSGDQDALRLVRFRRGNVLEMNRISVALVDFREFADFHADGTGSVRALVGVSLTGGSGNAQPSYRLMKIDPARLTIAGPYTIGGSPATGTVTLDQPAPAGGATFLLYSNNAAAAVPTSVTIPAGQASANFTITTTAVATNVKPTINARYDGLNLQTNFDLAAPLIQSVTASPQVQYGGLAGTGTVTLTGPAPTGGKVVSLTSSNTSRVTVPASINVPAGQASASFAITRIPTLVNASSVISATTGAVTKTVFVAVNAPIFLTATLGQTTLKGGQSTTMTLTINAPAPSGYTVTLVSGAPSLVTLPSSFAIPQNATTVNVPVSTSAVTSTIAITLVAYRGPYVRVMSLTLTP